MSWKTDALYFSFAWISISEKLVKKMEKCQDFVLDSFLEELEVFRWRLYIAKDASAEERSNLFEEACSKQISELFIEECLIAGCNMNTVHNKKKLKEKNERHKINSNYF